MAGLKHARIAADWLATMIERLRAQAVDVLGLDAFTTETLEDLYDMCGGASVSGASCLR